MPAPLCWATGDCERPVYHKQGKWRCPTHGPLRALSGWMETHLLLTHTSPATVDRVFEPRGDQDG